MRPDLSLLRSSFVLWAAASVACAADPAADGESSSSSPSTSDPDTSSATDPVGESSGDESSSGDDDPSGTTGDPGACVGPLGVGADPIFEQPHGTFAYRETDSYKTLRGFVSDGAPFEFHTESDRAGVCRLLTFESTTCDPACEWPAMCVDSQCVTQPPYLSAGDVTLGGVDGTLAVSKDAQHYYYWDRQGGPAATMPSLTAEGADVPAFELSVCPIDAPTPTSDWSALLAARAPGAPVVLEWSDPVASARVYLRMTTGIGTHGGISPVEVECEGPDVGVLELPGAFLDALYAEGWSCGECGGNDLVRYHADATNDGVVQLRAEASTNFWFIP